MSASQSTARRGTILLVDDEREILVALEDLFDDSYDIVATTSPIEALQIVEERRDIAVILSDQRMPEMTGDQFLAEARRFSDAEAILLTGYADLDAVIAAINRGQITGYAHKPWEPEALRTMVATAFDNHRLKRDLQFERELFRGLIESSADAISVKDANARYVRLNQPKLATLGRDADACLNRCDDELLEGDAGAASRMMDERVLRDGERHEKVETFEANHARQWRRVQRIPVVAGGERLLVTVENDITALRELEQRLHQSEKLQALGTLAGGIAHDFNNLLTAVIGNLELAQRRGTPETLPRFIANAAEAARRGSGLTQRLLAFSRQNDITATTIDANGVIAGMDDLLHRTLGGMVTLDLSLAEDCWPAHGDAAQLELAILNLCINARDAMPDGGPIRIATANMEVGDGDDSHGLTPGCYVQIAVSDKGVGMPPELIKRVFEPFFTTKEIGKGTGLGLSMVYGMTKALGGLTRIESRPGEGTTVMLYLPRSTEEATVSSGEEGIELESDRRLRILLVDDDPDVRDVAAGYLSALGHEAVVARGGNDALAKLAAASGFDLVVTDFAMPGLSGVDLADKVSADHPQLRFLLITGFAEMATVPDDMKVLRKPFSQDDLKRAVAEATAK